MIFDATTKKALSIPFAFRQPIRYDYTTQVVYTTTENLRSMQQFPWPSHGRQCDDMYGRPRSYEKPEISGIDQFPLNLSLQQSQTGANVLNMPSTDRPCSRSLTPINHGLCCSDQKYKKQHVSLQSQMFFRLPNTMLPKFDGNPLEWNK